MENSASLTEIDQIDFHDVPVDKIAFEIDTTNQFIVDFSLYVDENQHYDDYRMTFEDIRELKTDPFHMTEKSNLEIYSLDYTKKDTIECSILFLCGFGEPSFEVNLTCKSIRLEKTKNGTRID